MKFGRWLAAAHCAARRSQPEYCCGQVRRTDDAQNPISFFEAFLHPPRNVAAGLDFPIMNSRPMAELLELPANPEGPLPVAICVADENIGPPGFIAVFDARLFERCLFCSRLLR